jgi:hypothetical protein
MNPRLFNFIAALVYTAALAVLFLDLLVWRPN